MSSVLKIVYFSSLTIAVTAVIGGITQLMTSFPSNQAHSQSGTRSTTLVAGFTPDPSRPPVVTQGSGTR